ncbi:MAG: EamA family transporter [Patescibacteria group bacterium]|nr:EamA family transporter [Patescibacteria group bacterium]MDD4610915.1 EamA family transporter [Patescibacteria group bacterium]
MWLIASVGSYFINGGVYIADKFLLSKKIHSSITYAFYVGIWSIFNFVILPFDFWLPNLRELSLDLLAGVLFLVTLVFWYKALHQSEATRVVPIVGALVPIFSFLFSFIFLGEELTERQLLAFLVLINGGILISIKHTRFYQLKEVHDRLRNKFGDLVGSVHAAYRPTQRLIINSVVSALFFAGYYILIKYIYTAQPFIGGFVWSRLGTFLAVLFMLFIPSWRRLIFEKQRGQKSLKNLAFFIFVRLLAAGAFIMINWAISLGNVALINALQGVQYIFLFFMVLFLSAKYPKILEEEVGGGVLLQKIIGTCLITIGLYMLVV